MFLKLIKVLFISCALSLISLAAHANAHTYDKIVVFGDSLSDNGNLFQATGLPEKPYFDGRFSNGSLWIEMVAKALHLDINSKTQFVDYAFGGAWAADPQNGVGGLVPLSFERSLYFTDTPSHSQDISNNLFVMWIGNNDYLQDGRLKENPDTVTTTTINAIKTHIDALIDSGAKHFLILNLPDLGETPKAREAIALGHPEFANSISSLSKLHNKKLAQLITEESALHPDVKFISFDLASYLTDLIANPAKYDIKDVINPCYSKGIGGYEKPAAKALAMQSRKVRIRGLSANMSSYPDLAAQSNQQQQTEYCANTDDYLFWDYVHPTARAHELISVFVADLLTTGKTNPAQS